MSMNRTTTRQTASVREAMACDGVRRRRASHTTVASSASAHVKGKRPSRYGSQPTKRRGGLSSSKGNTNHSARLLGPKLAELNVAVIARGSHQGDRIHWLPKGKMGLSKWIHSAYA